MKPKRKKAHGMVANGPDDVQHCECQECYDVYLWNKCCDAWEAHLPTIREIEKFIYKEFEGDKPYDTLKVAQAIHHRIHGE